MKTTRIARAILTLALAAVLLLGQASAFPVFAADGDAAVDNGIPVLYVHIDEGAEGYGTIAEMNASPDHSVSCTGTLTLDVPDGYTGDYSDAPLSDLNDVAIEYIRGRGNSTWEADKKPYKLKLDKSQDLLGMGKNKHWVLLANRLDQSLLRNRLVSYMGTALGLDYTPKMLPVDLVVNGDYYGSYLLAEQIRIGKTRVNIDELDAGDNAEPEITGGYLLAMLGDADKESEDNTFATENGMQFLFNEPEFDFSDGAEESGTQAQKAYITDYLQKTENAILGENFCDANGVSYTEYMDVQSAADYWWIQVFTDSYDAYRTSSTYLYKVRSGKLFWGPLWDFDLALGNASANGIGFNIGRPNLWLDTLRANDPAYLQVLQQRWKVLDGIVEEMARDGGVIDRMADEIKDSWKADADKWGEWIASRKPLTDLETEVRDLKLMFNTQRAFINDNLDKLSRVYYNVRFVAEGKELASYRLRLGEGIDPFPEAPEKKGYTFLGWEDENGALVEQVAGMDDMTLTAKYRAIPPFRFEDVPAGSFYDVPVHWAVENYIVNGITDTAFGPEQSCTRAHIVTLLWRAAGCPEPGEETTPFRDVAADSYYAKAVAWATEMDITNGTSETAFSPDKVCTRGEIVTFLWRSQYAPEPEQRENPFKDVGADAYYTNAVLWAVENEITNGMTETTFAPGAPCTRAQAVTFLYRAQPQD